MLTMLILWLSPFWVFRCDTREWATGMFNIWLLPQTIEYLMKPVVLFMKEWESYLPEEMCVWFEEATLVIDEFGCQRYTRPNIVLGETVISSVMALIVIYKRTTYASEESLMLEIGAAIVTLSRLHKHVTRTYEQYLRNLPWNRTAADKTIKKTAMELLQMEEKVLLIDSKLLPLDAQIWYTDMLKCGTHKCVEFLNEVLRNALTDRVEDIAKKGIPLYHQWQDLEKVQKAVEPVLELQEGQKYAVHGAQRRLMTAQLRQLKARMDSFSTLAGRVLAADQEQFSDMVSALAEVDRRQSRRQTTESTTATTAATPTLASHDPEASGKVELPADLQDEQINVDKQSSNAAPDPGPKEQEYDLECIICFDNMASIVFTACGHLAYCKACRRKALKKSLGADFKHYSNALRSRMVCPLCRRESSTAELAKFQGTVYQ
eukprot:TRINITY_DN98583_c0_g1_i1.p1 TRINITY_DN98583_c0_g1~~TRINITY_DN98583_c0_g1_i1.p1  ORF type:complete len:497 (+),score=88.77 TRINITY_DN98583_c0_g1_i1:194-1492(+)